MTVAYKIHTAKETLKEPPPIKWIIEDVIGEQTFALFYGEAGSKKTYSLFDMCVCMAAGENWLGHKTKSVKVLIIDQESGELRMWRRMHLILNGHKIKKDIPLDYVSMAGFNLMKATDTEHLKILIRKTNAQVVLIDALVDVMPGADESSAKDTSVAFGNLKDLVHCTGITLIIIHHTNRKGMYRGSSNIKAQVDMMLEIESAQKSSRVQFKADKLRDSDELEFVATAHFDKKYFYLSLGDPTCKSTTCVQYILDSIDRESCSLQTLQTNAPKKLSASAIKTALYKLIDEKKIARANPGAQGVEALYERRNGHTN